MSCSLQEGTTLLGDDHEFSPSSSKHGGILEWPIEHRRSEPLNQSVPNFGQWEVRSTATPLLHFRLASVWPPRDGCSADRRD